MVEIPCRPDLPHYSMQVVLESIERESVTYTLEFRWNDREGSWYMDLKTEDETPILSSVKVVVNFFLAARVNVANRPRGRFIAYDTTGQDLNPGLNDLGDRVVLVFLTPEEVLALE